MICTKKHFEEYKDVFEKDAVQVFNSLEEASEEFSKRVEVSKETAKERIENNTNADWIVSPDNKVYVMN